VAGLLAAPAWAGPRVTGIAVDAVGPAQRVTISLSEPATGVSLFAMDAPQRLVVDLPGAETTAQTVAGTAAVAKVRAAQFRADAARIVIDLAAPVSASDLAATGNTLSVTLRPADAPAFKRVLARGRQSFPAPLAAVAAVLPQTPFVPSPVVAKAAPEPVRVATATPTPTPVRAEPKFVVTPPPVEAAPPPAAPKRIVRPQISGYRPVVVIDAGHGGHDVGAPSVITGRYEKEVTLAVAKAIRRELEDSGQFKVVLTRDDDRFIPLSDRVRIARAAKADLFISVHADSAPSAEARGATVYTLSEVASDREAARLAAKENRAGMIGGYNIAAESADVASVLFDLTQRETMNTSADFATKLQREMGDEVHFRSHAHRFAGFVVLKAPDTPSVLLETGYMSNEEDSKFLFSEDGQRRVARGVRQAVEAHFKPRIAAR
jgi:N-acetylmuramoyl-L-alanine amidase